MGGARRERERRHIPPSTLKPIRSKLSTPLLHVVFILILFVTAACCTPDRRKNDEELASETASEHPSTSNHGVSEGPGGRGQANESEVDGDSNDGDHDAIRRGDDDNDDNDDDDDDDYDEEEEERRHARDPGRKLLLSRLTPEMLPRDPSLRGDALAEVKRFTSAVVKILSDSACFQSSGNAGAGGEPRCSVKRLESSSVVLFSRLSRAFGRAKAGVVLGRLVEDGRFVELEKGVYSTLWRVPAGRRILDRKKRRGELEVNMGPLAQAALASAARDRERAKQAKRAAAANQEKSEL